MLWQQLFSTLNIHFNLKKCYCSHPPYVPILNCLLIFLFIHTVYAVINQLKSRVRHVIIWGLMYMEQPQPWCKYDLWKKSIMTIWLGEKSIRHFVTLYMQHNIPVYVSNLIGWTRCGWDVYFKLSEECVCVCVFCECVLKQLSLQIWYGWLRLLDEDQRWPWWTSHLHLLKRYTERQAAV